MASQDALFGTSSIRGFLRLTFHGIILLCLQPNLKVETIGLNLNQMLCLVKAVMVRSWSCIKPCHMFTLLNRSPSDRPIYLMTRTLHFIFFFWILECVQVHWPWIEGLCQSRVRGRWSHFIYANSGCFWWWENRGWKVRNWNVCHFPEFCWSTYCPETFPFVRFILVYGTMRVHLFKR